MLDWLNNFLSWIDSVFYELEQGIKNTASDIDTILNNIIDLQEQIKQLIQYAEVYIIVSGVVLLVIFVLLCVQNSRIKALTAQVDSLTHALLPTEEAAADTETEF